MRKLWDDIFACDVTFYYMVTLQKLNMFVHMHQDHDIVTLQPLQTGNNSAASSGKNNFY